MGSKKNRCFNLRLCFWTNRRSDSCVNTATKNNLALHISIRTTNNNLASKVKPKSFVREMTPREKSIYNAVVPTLTTTIAFASSENNNYVWFGLRGRSTDADLENPLFAVVVARHGTRGEDAVNQAKWKPFKCKLRARSLLRKAIVKNKCLFAGSKLSTRRSDSLNRALKSFFRSSWSLLTGA